MNIEKAIEELDKIIKDHEKENPVWSPAILYQDLRKILVASLDKEEVK